MENTFNLSKLCNGNMTTNQQKEYLCKYFIPLTSGDHAQLNNDNYKVVDDAVIKKTYFNRMPKCLKDYYFKELTTIRDITYELNKPLLFDNKLNLCPQMPHEYMEYHMFSDEIKAKVEMMWDYVMEVWCGNDDTV